MRDLEKLLKTTRVGDMIVNEYRLSAFPPGASTLPILPRTALLRTAGIDTIRIAKGMTNVCCDTSAHEAAMTDFRAIMVEDAKAARRDAAHTATLTTVLQSFGDVRRCDDIISASGAGA